MSQLQQSHAVHGGLWRVVLVAVLLVVLTGAMLWARPQAGLPIRVGVLYASTGPMATSEQPLLAAVRLAVEELNAQGGLLGRTVQLVVADTRSDPAHAAAEAERLISAEQVSVLFACWTSACRRALKKHPLTV